MTVDVVLKGMSGNAAINKLVGNWWSRHTGRINAYAVIRSSMCDAIVKAKEGTRLETAESLIAEYGKLALQSTRTHVEANINAKMLMSQAISLAYMQLTNVSKCALAVADMLEYGKEKGHYVTFELDTRHANYKSLVGKTEILAEMKGHGIKGVKMLEGSYRDTSKFIKSNYWRTFHVRFKSEEDFMLWRLSTGFHVENEQTLDFSEVSTF